MKTIIPVAIAMMALASATPAFAGSSNSGSTSEAGNATSVPEPSDALLLLMGIAGVVVGRRLHARNQRED